MRLAPLLLCTFIATAGMAADGSYVKLTMTDGRTLTGEYDAASGLLLLDGKASMRMTIKADDVKRVDPIARPAVAAEKPAADAKKEVTRADVDAAATAYAAVVVAYYTDVIAKAPEMLEPAKITDASTVQQARDAEHTRADREALASLRSRLAHLSKQVATEVPLIRAIRAGAFDHSITGPGSEGETARKLLGVAAIKTGR